MRIDEIKKELKELDEVCKSSFNNEGLFNEIRNMKEKLEKELKELLEKEK